MLNRNRIGISLYFDLAKDVSICLQSFKIMRTSSEVSLNELVVYTYHAFEKKEAVYSFLDVNGSC